MWIRKAATVAAVILMLIVFVQMNGSVRHYINAVKSGDATFVFGTFRGLSEEDRKELYNRIVVEAESYYKPPINAKIDRVWKAIPGYNGLAVDIDRTYEAALKMPLGSAIPYHYKEIEPRIGLEQLGSVPIYRGNSEKKMVSFMINVAWGNEYLEPILNTLRQEGVKATFFLDGSWLKNNVALAKQIQEDGHELSNHAYSHPDMSALGREAQRGQIVKTESLLKELLGVKNKWFAPPSGAYNDATVQIAKEQGLMTVLWTIDTVDWRMPPAETVLRKVRSKLEPGALILMHPTATTRDSLAGMINIARERGLAVGTVSETLSSKRKQPAVEPLNVI
ncbi:polysaccharide deacetylase family protein [Paenibacillus chungangensis]|uniref:Polysaccharide deacetylase family protein n=1 Tax=Paenibacillus chungangensis TaxID=696535 RepID=A0ABW3HPR9_9BACL